MNMFITLNDVIFSQPFPAIVTILIVLGMVRLGQLLTDKYPSNHLDNSMLGYIVIIILVSIFFNFIATVGFLNIYVGRGVGIVLGGCGLYFLFECFQQTKNIEWEKLNNNKLELVGLSIVALLAVSMFLLSITPHTDADSLDYHLGVPLDWVRNGGAYPRPDWNHSRVIGLGEAINVFGLLNGTDNLGQLVQYSGLWIVCFTLINSIPSKKIKILIFLFVFTVPLNLFFSVSQKPQLFQAALIFFFLINVYRIKPRNNRIDFLYLLLILFYVIGSKVSFIIIGGCAYLYGLYYSYLNRTFKVYIVASFIIFSLVLFPSYLRVYSYYGDPISPMLEFMKAIPSQQTLDFAESLKTPVRGGITWQNLIFFPLRISITAEPALLSTVLGVGLLVVLFIRRKLDTETLNLLYLVGVVYFVNIALLEQTQARYYMEGYWILIYTYLKHINYINRYIFGLLMLQGVTIVIAGVLGLVFLFPAVFTDNFRDEVMSRNANGYEIAKWINEILPEDARVMANVRSHALLPRNFISYEKVAYLKSEEVIRVIKEDKINSILIGYPAPKNMEPLLSCADILYQGVRSFQTKSRNPLNTGAVYYAQLILFDSGLSRCE